METYFGFDEESVESETSSLTSFNTDLTDRTPATPEEELEEVIDWLNFSLLQEIRLVHRAFGNWETRRDMFVN